MHLDSAFYIRIVAIVTLLLGLSETSRLLGVSLGARSPLSVLGITSFTYLAAFSLALLFSAVGLWMKARWGGLILVVALGTELGLHLAGSPYIGMTLFGMVLRMALLASVLLMFAIGLRARRASGRE